MAFVGCHGPPSSNPGSDYPVPCPRTNTEGKGPGQLLLPPLLSTDHSQEEDSSCFHHCVTPRERSWSSPATALSPTPSCEQQGQSLSPYLAEAQRQGQDEGVKQQHKNKVRPLFIAPMQIGPGPQAPKWGHWLSLRLTAILFCQATGLTGARPHTASMGTGSLEAPEAGQALPSACGLLASIPWLPCSPGAQSTKGVGMNLSSVTPRRDCPFLSYQIHLEVAPAPCTSTQVPKPSAREAK